MAEIINLRQVRKQKARADDLEAKWTGLVQISRRQELEILQLQRQLGVKSVALKAVE